MCQSERIQYTLTLSPDNVSAVVSVPHAKEAAAQMRGVAKAAPACEYEPRADDGKVS